MLILLHYDQDLSEKIIILKFILIHHLIIEMQYMYLLLLEAYYEMKMNEYFEESINLSIMLKLASLLIIILFKTIYVETPK